MAFLLARYYEGGDAAVGRQRLSRDSGIHEINSFDGCNQFYMVQVGAQYSFRND